MGNFVLVLFSDDQSARLFLLGRRRGKKTKCRLSPIAQEGRDIPRLAKFVSFLKVSQGRGCDDSRLNLDANATVPTHKHRRMLLLLDRRKK